ncbi:helix-turn-helix transcriptional regulator [Mycolicibacterium sp.]|uniref:helix-turn-helix transcriptional regulator n=1 Tax=Mycolicibacterium sp. TaxID=2320850 RepID=UPI0037CC51E6
MGIWEDRAFWWDATYTVDDVAKILGVAPATINQLLSRGTFPGPDRRDGRRNYWTPARIYRFILAERAQHELRVPRLFPRVDRPRPATFLGSLFVINPSTLTPVVVYRWAPGDGAGGEVCLVYPVEDTGSNDYPSHARALYTALGFPPGAVAMVSGEVRGGYPQVWVFDGRDPEFMPEENADGAVLYDWHELSCLLRVDLPWWPAGLRHEHEMLAWEPGAAAVELRPRYANMDPRAVTDIIDESTPELVRAALQHRAADLEQRFGSGDRFLETAGFVYAAVNVGNQEPVALWTWDQAAAIMHYHVESPAAAAAALELINPYPVAHYTFVVTSAQLESSDMAREWARGLEKFDGPPELGHLKAARRAGREPLAYYARHKHNAECWAAVGTTGTIYATVGSHVPAPGRLTAVEVLGTQAAFFRDDSNDPRVWPLPHQDTNSFNTGYTGGSPIELCRAILSLRDRAANTVHSWGDPETNSHLWSLVSTRKPPLTLGEDVFRSEALPAVEQDLRIVDREYADYRELVQVYGLPLDTEHPTGGFRFESDWYFRLSGRDLDPDLGIGRWLVTFASRNDPVGAARRPDAAPNGWLIAYAIDGDNRKTGRCVVLAGPWNKATEERLFPQRPTEAESSLDDVINWLRDQ